MALVFPRVSTVIGDTAEKKGVGGFKKSALVDLLIGSPMARASI